MSRRDDSWHDILPTRTLARPGRADPAQRDTAFTHAIWIAVTGPVDRTGTAFAMLAGWLINLAVAGYAIRRPTPVPRKPATAGAAR